MFYKKNTVLLTSHTMLLPVSRVSELQNFLGLVLDMRSIVLVFSRFLKHVGFFIKFLRRYILQKSFKFESVISKLKSPSNMRVVLKGLVTSILTFFLINSILMHCYYAFLLARPYVTFY